MNIEIESHLVVGSTLDDENGVAPSRVEIIGALVPRAQQQRYQVNARKFLRTFL